MPSAPTVSLSRFAPNDMLVKFLIASIGYIRTGREVIHICCVQIECIAVIFKISIDFRVFRQFLLIIHKNYPYC